MLYSIFKDFGIAAKVQNVVTDNAGNFTKAFSLYHTNTDEADSDSEENSLSSMNITDLLDDMPLCPESEDEEIIFTSSQALWEPFIELGGQL